MTAPRRAALAAFAASLLLALPCCEPAPEPARVTTPAADAAPNPAAANPAPPGAPACMVDVAAEVGIDFVHNTGAFGRKWLPETMGSGCAWVDYDSDGDPDAFLLSGKDFDGHPTGRRQTCALYRNDGGRFADVTAETGLATPLYAMGVAYADWDADGDPDLYVTALGPNRLYRNDGGRFTDVAREAGVGDPGFGSSVSWLDYDRDGDADLFTLNYVNWTPETDIFCSLDGTNKSYCTPEAYEGSSPRLYRNDGARFADVSAAAGIHDPSAKSLGILCVDYDGDGWDDVFVANDTQPNFLFHNQGDGTFVEQGVVGGVAFDEAGRARGAMGVDAADYDGSGHPSFVIGNFSNEMLALYHNEGAGFFIDAAPTSEVGRQSLLTLAFGTFFVDHDLDGRADIFVANGHVENEIQKVQSRVSYAQPPHLFHNLGDGRFQDVAPLCEELREPMVARGAASADFDGDGDLDVLVTTSGGAAKLLRNDAAGGDRFVRIRLVGGAGSNPDGYGARVRLIAGGATQ
ncbi:MAG: FG-GAP repeat domain-containing protein, partial [Candidatus Eiseniibacteriota bacterium]